MPDLIAETEFEMWDGRAVETWSVAIYSPEGSGVHWKCKFRLRKGREVVEDFDVPGVDAMQALVYALSIAGVRIRELRAAGGQVSWYGRNDGYICFDQFHTADPAWTGHFDYLSWRGAPHLPDPASDCSLG
jgi:hypothetical protein